jgi:hypothetical protein
MAIRPGPKEQAESSVEIRPDRLSIAFWPGRNPMVCGLTSKRIFLQFRPYRRSMVNQPGRNAMCKFGQA